MGKYYGKIGYAIPVETAPGVWRTDVNIIEKSVIGDVLKGSSGWNGSSHLNDDMRINVRISVVSDAFLRQHFSHIKYCEWMGVKWKVTDIEPSRPRLILTLGGEYNGEQTSTACRSEASSRFG